MSDSHFYHPVKTTSLDTRKKEQLEVLQQTANKLDKSRKVGSRRRGGEGSRGLGMRWLESWLLHLAVFVSQFEVGEWMLVMRGTHSSSEISVGDTG